MIIILSGIVIVEVNGMKKMSNKRLIMMGNMINDLEERNCRLAELCEEINEDFGKCIRTKLIQSLLCYAGGLIIGFIIGWKLI